MRKMTQKDVEKNFNNTIYIWVGLQKIKRAYFSPNECKLKRLIRLSSCLTPFGPSENLDNKDQGRSI